MTSVWRIPLCTGKERIKNIDGKKAHSTQKPEEILKRVILSNSHEGDVVLDPFSGSGTTCAVAKKLNRIGIGIEREKEYVDISYKRLKSINVDDFKELRLTEPDKKIVARVSMAQLIEANFLKSKQTIYTNKKQQKAMILDDGSLQHHEQIGSIHQIGATLKETESCNGWMYWYYEEKGQLKLIDELRKSYRKKYYK